MGRSACFPVYDGVAWNSVAHVLNKTHSLPKCPLSSGVAAFFGSSCTPGLPKGLPKRMNAACGNQAMYRGEFGAIRCLIHERGDVAFVSESSLHRFLAGELFKQTNRQLTAFNVLDPAKNPRRLNITDFKVLQPEKSKSYYLSWAPLGQAMVRSSSSDLWIKDAFDVFLQMDALFGRNYTSITTPFTMFGMFDGVSNVLFHDKTMKLRNVPFIKNTDRMSDPYNEILEDIEICSSSSKLMPVLFVFICAVALHF